MNVAHAPRRTVARRTGWRTGNSVIEMSFVFPILLMLSMGMVEFGQFFYVRSAFVGAARDGCRKATLASSTKQTIIDTINATLRQAINTTPAIDVGVAQSSWLKFYDISPLNPNTPILMSDPTSIPSGDGVEVSLTVMYDQIPGTFRPLNAIYHTSGIGTNKPIAVQTMMVKE